MRERVAREMTKMMKSARAMVSTAMVKATRANDGDEGKQWQQGQW